MKKVMQKDAERTEDVVAYNIIPLDALSTTTNAIVTFSEVWFRVWPFVIASFLDLEVVIPFAVLHRFNLR